MNVMTPAAIADDALEHQGAHQRLKAAAPGTAAMKIEDPSTKRVGAERASTIKRGQGSGTGDNEGQTILRGDFRANGPGRFFAMGAAQLRDKLPVMVSCFFSPPLLFF